MSLSLQGQKRLKRILWRGTMLASLVGLVFLYWRYDTVRLPAAGCSPLLRFRAGSWLLVDRHPDDYRVGDAVFFERPDEVLLLVAIAELGDSGLCYLATDDPECPGTDSRSLGWVALEHCVGRVILSLPPD